MAAWRRRVPGLVLVNIAILSAVFARLFILAIVHTLLFPAIHAQYLAPLYPLVLVFVMLTLIELFRRVALCSAIGLRHPRLLSRKLRWE